MSKFLAPHQTVGWMIEQLSNYPANMKVVFAAGVADTSCWLSDYVIKKGEGFTPKNENHLCIDVGDE